MFNFCIKDKYNSTAKKLFKLNDLGFGMRVGIITPEQANTLINLNLFERFCLKIPYSFKVGEYFTVLDNVAFDLNEYARRSSFSVKETLAPIKGKVFKVDRVKGNGILVFTNEHARHGFYANWIRHSTEEEIQDYKNENSILNYW